MRLPIGAIVRALRPRQFVKNSLVFAPLLFTIGLAWQPTAPATWVPLLARSGLAFVAFCCACSAGYLINDVRDAGCDRMHPGKCLRPVAAGEITPRQAVVAAALLFLAGALADGTLGRRVALVLFIYAALTLSYSFALKRVMVLDIAVIATGYVLRAMAGAFAGEAPLSPWLYLCTLLAALFVVVHKRRHELLLLRDGAGAHRATLAAYSAPALGRLGAALAGAALLAYGLYAWKAANLPRNHAMVASVPFVLLGLARYMYLVHRRGAGGSPAELFTSDAPLIACLAGWAVTCGLLFALFH